MPAQLDIVIVNWNSNVQLAECLNSIPAALDHSFELKTIVVVDNASTDASLQGIDKLALPIQLILNKENKGFGYACNQGAKESSANYLLFLNPDTRLYPNSLSVPLQFMEKPENNKIGIVGIQLIDENGHIARSCARFPTFWNFLSHTMGLNYLLPKQMRSYVMLEWAHDHSQKVDHVIGAFFLVRQRLFQQTTGFDERFFVYFEDLDFSLTAKKLGCDSFYLADVSAFHRGGGVSRQIKAKRLYYSLSSRLIYSFKNFTLFQYYLILLATYTLEPISRCVLSLFRGYWQDAKETCQAYGMLYKDILKFLSPPK